MRRRARRGASAAGAGSYAQQQPLHAACAAGAGMQERQRVALQDDKREAVRNGLLWTRSGRVCSLLPLDGGRWLAAGDCSSSVKLWVSGAASHVRCRCAADALQTVWDVRSTSTLRAESYVSRLRLACPPQDLRMLRSAGRPSTSAVGSPTHVPNAPAFAGDDCPIAGLAVAPRAGVLLSSCIAWWTADAKVSAVHQLELDTAKRAVHPVL